MLHPTVIITPWADTYPRVKVQVWSDPLARYMEFDFQVCGAGNTAESVAMGYISSNGWLAYWRNYTQEQATEADKMDAAIMRDAAIYGHSD